jgi:hypothetical protein
VRRKLPTFASLSYSNDRPALGVAVHRAGGFVGTNGQQMSPATTRILAGPLALTLTWAWPEETKTTTNDDGDEAV